ncbi:MAG: putative NRPS-like protein biosynthetic cluster [Pycnora praestabilis]|nr:MAG: putative NRPS-like protein biosynthetic cluster [Pycnora praestabilis]
MGKEAENLYQLLEAAASTSDAGITLYPPGSKTSHHTTYKEVFEQAQARAHLIHQLKGISDNSVILLHFDQHKENIEWFWAVTLAGYLPTISTPFVNDPEQRKKHLSHLQTVLHEPVILTSKNLVPEFLGLEQLNIHAVDGLKPQGGVNQNGTSKSGASKKPEDLAILMLTSGSTGNAKAVCQRHGQVIAASKGKSVYHETKSDDVFLNWIGLDHVASLIEVHLHAMRLGAEQVHIQASDLLVDPIFFLELINKHRVAYTFAPNFFMASIKRALENSGRRHSTHDVHVEGSVDKRFDFDLSCLRALVSGGEANVVDTCEILTQELRPYGVKGDIIRPGFGMTETCGGAIYGKSCPSYDIARHLEFASLGSCVPGIHMRVINDQGKEAAEGEVGNLQNSGPIIFREYYNNPTATKESFTDDGWFITGDRAFLDSEGNLNLSGRAKETIIINGVKYFPHEVETALEEAHIAGATPSYTVVFPHRPKGSDTEVLCVVYLPTFHPEDDDSRVETVDAISKVSGMICGARPYQIIPLTKELLPKSSLGKLSRAKIRIAFESGKYDELVEKNNSAVRAYRLSKREQPSTENEELILSEFGEMFNVDPEEIGVGSSLFDMGVSSIDLIGFKRRIQKRLELKNEIPLVTVLMNPTIRGMANALEEMSKPKVYNPVVTLQTKGDKTPLWLVHPGVGEVLVFLNLGKYITDRPVYSLRARGFDEGETFFKDIPECVNIYKKEIQRVQPNGPYAIAGYSYGAMLAFETSKLLEADGAEIAFFGSFNLPPNIKLRMRQLDWIEVLLNLSYFLDLMSEDYAHEISGAMHERTRDEVLEYILELAPPSRIEELTLTKEYLSTWASLSHELHHIACDYDPSGSISCVDIFYAIPLQAVAKTKKEWLANHLVKWQDYSRSDIRFHEMEGAHYTMMGPEHILFFQKTLKKALAERGI